MRSTSSSLLQGSSEIQRIQHEWKTLKHKTAVMLPMVGHKKLQNKFLSKLSS